MPVPFASPESVKYAGATPNYMTPRTPKTPDEHGSSLKKAGFPHLKQSRDKESQNGHQARMERFRRSGLKHLKQHGSVFYRPIPPGGKPLAREILKTAQSIGTVPIGSLESLRGFSRSRNTQAGPPDHSVMIQENAKTYRNIIHHAAAAHVKKQMATTYIELKDEEPMPKPIKLFIGHTQPCFEVLERVDHSASKTRISAIRASKTRIKFAQVEARRKAEALDQVPKSYAAWKKLDEPRQARVAKFLQLPDDQKDQEVTLKRWNRNDAMTLNQQYKNEPEFQAEVSAILAKRVTTDPRRRPTLVNAQSITSAS